MLKVTATVCDIVRHCVLNGLKLPMSLQATPSGQTPAVDVVLDIDSFCQFAGGPFRITPEHGQIGY
jgi:hypothetical protein